MQAHSNCWPDGNATAQIEYKHSVDLSCHKINGLTCIKLTFAICHCLGYEHHFYFFPFLLYLLKPKHPSLEIQLCVKFWCVKGLVNGFLSEAMTIDHSSTIERTIQTLIMKYFSFRETLKTSAEAVGVFKTIIWCLEAFIWFLEKLYDIIALLILICVFSLVDKKIGYIIQKLWISKRLLLFDIYRCERLSPYMDSSMLSMEPL